MVASAHRVARWLLLAILLALQAACGPSQGPLQDLTEAQLESMPGTGTGPSTEASTTQKVSLPHVWNPAGMSGQYRYRMAFSVPPEALVSGWGLYLPRVGNRFHVRVNGQVVARFGDLRAVDVDHGMEPQYVYMAPDTLRAGSNELVLEVAGEMAGFAGVSRLTVGPPDEVRARYEWRDLLQSKSSYADIATSLLFAIAAIPLAWRSRDRAMLLFCAACLFGALCVSFRLVVRPPLPHDWWGLLTDAIYICYLLCLAAFCAETVILRGRAVRGMMATLTLASLVCIPWYSLWRNALVHQVWLTVVLAFSVLLCLMVIWQWFRVRNRESAILAVAGAGAVSMGIYDHWLVFYSSDGFSSLTISRYSQLLFLIAMGWLLLERQRRQEAVLQRAREGMLTEVAEHRARLEQRFDEQQAQAHLKLQRQERDRILCDIHDGMGLQLQALLAQVESGDLKRDDLVHEVRTAIEQMRMLVSNTEQFDGDLLMLLGQIRHQVERRLKHSGVRTQWHCTLAPDTYSLDGARCIALQRLIFELTTNVVRHAQARTLSVSIGPDAQSAGAWVLSFCDDGIGFDPSTAGFGSGMRSLARRAADMDARGEFIAGRPQGTCYVLHMAPTPSLAPDAPRDSLTQAP